MFLDNQTGSPPPPGFKVSFPLSDDPSTSTTGCALNLHPKHQLMREMKIISLSHTGKSPCEIA